MKYILLTSLVLFSTFLTQQAQEKTDKEEEIVIKTVVKDGDKKEKTVQVISGNDLKDIQSMIDSLLKSVDWSDGLSKMNIISVPGTDGIETLNWFELNDLGEMGEFNVFDEQMKWLEKNSNKADKPFLGVIIDTDNQLERGIHIMDIVDNSSAQAAGLMKDDILLGIGSHEINSLEDLVKALKEHKVNDDIELHYSRDGKKSVAEATLKSLLESNYNLTNSFNYMLPDCCKADPQCKHTSDKVYKAFAHQQRPKLGVHIVDLDEEMITDLKVSEGKGVLVTKVLEASTAKKMGLKINDVLTSLNDTEISNVKALNSILEQHQLGDEIQINVIRYGKELTLHGVLFEFNNHSAIDQMLFFGKEE